MVLPTTGPADEHEGDRYLAGACLTGEQRALEHLDALLRQAAIRIARSGVSGDELEEAMQLVRMKLLMPQGERPPRLSAYAGRGPLAAWLQAVLLRQLIDVKRKSQPTVSLADTADLSDPLHGVEDPEVAYLHSRYRDAFHAAFRSAVAALSAKEIGVLRLHVKSRMSIDRIAACCCIGRSTAARWLISIRERVLELTRSRLAEQLGVTESEAVSLVYLLKNELDTALTKSLGAPPDPKP